MLKLAVQCLRQQLPQYVLQDSAVAIVVNFLRRVDTHRSTEFLFTRPNCKVATVGKLVRDRLAQAHNFEGFLASETEARRILLRQELQGQYAHADEVGAVDALEALGEDELDAE